MKIFYHNDMDGQCAAYIVYWLDNHSIDKDTFQAINYGMEFPFTLICKGELVYILDYSIEPEEMTKLLAITENVIWIDHHKTAIEKYEKWPDLEKLDGIRDVAASGCECTYSWFRPDHRIDAVPEWVRLIGDRDTWTWKYGDRAKFFFAGMQAYNTSPNAPVWVRLKSGLGGGIVDLMVKDGRTIQEYKDRTQQEYLKENGFWVEFHGHKCYAACGLFSSQPFEAVVPEADIWLTFRYMQDGFWMVSLYSTKVDVSEIAKKHGYHGKRGGGHTVAAGFVCDYPPFLPYAKAYSRARLEEEAAKFITVEDIEEHLDAIERR